MRSSRLAALLALLTLSAPLAVFGAPASFEASRSLVTATSSAGNTYLLGGSTVVGAPVSGDLTAAGGSLIVTAPVGGDALLLGGSVNERGRIMGDARIAGGDITVEAPVGGDLAAIGFSVHDRSRARGSVFITALSADLSAGAEGPVMIFGNDVTLGGDYGGDVRVVASGKITLASSTAIAGALSYSSPEPAAIPPSAKIAGGVHYTNTSYVPSTSVVRGLSLASLGIFLLARVLGALILAGLLAGLFPRLAEAVTTRAASASVRRVFLTMLLGFATLIATPVLLVLLALTFIGLGIALLLFICYALLALLSYVYGGILIGGLIARRISGRTFALWRDGVLGIFILSVLGLVPFVGGIVVFLLTIFAAGALLILFFNFAFPHDAAEDDLV